MFGLQRLSNGSMESGDEASQVVELQELLEKQNYELAQMKERMSSLSSRVSEVEQELETARKDLIKSEDVNNKFQRDIKEVQYMGVCEFGCGRNCTPYVTSFLLKDSFLKRCLLVRYGPD